MSDNDAGGEEVQAEEETVKTVKDASVAVAEEGDGEAAAADEDIEEQNEGWLENYWTNSIGAFDGERFYLRSFPTWYRWTPWQYQQVYNTFSKDKPESGEVGNVFFEQTMGRITLWYALVGQDSDLNEDNFSVDLSSWELQVWIGGKNQTPGKAGGRKVSALCGELQRDIRRKHSWWMVTEESEYPGKWLVISLAKLEHRPWRSIWFDLCLNPHRKQSFDWTPGHISYQLMKLLRSEEDTLARISPGQSENQELDMCTGILPEKLCTGVDSCADETNEQLSVLIHLDEHTLELATGMVPLEELFSAEVTSGHLDVYLRYDGFALCSGPLLGAVIPSLTTWEVRQVRRKLPPNSDIKAPAYYNPALRITLTKAFPSNQPWGNAFSDIQLPLYEPPRERMPWTERMQRALILSPAAPTSEATKTERAKKMCTQMDFDQDSIMGTVTIIMHLEDRLEQLAWRYKVDLASFFSMNVGEKMLEVCVFADAEYRMCIGGLGGTCMPDKTSWELFKAKNENGDDSKDHMALKLKLTKASSSRGNWDPVFTHWQSWQVTENMHESLQNNPPPAVTGEPAKVVDA